MDSQNTSQAPPSTPGEVERLLDAVARIALALQSIDARLHEDFLFILQLRQQQDQEIKRLRQALQDASEHACYDEGAEFGIRPCCSTEDYKPHKSVCEMMKALSRFPQ